MTYTKNLAPRGDSEREENCQAAKPDGVNHSMTHPRMQAPIAAPARRVTVDQHQAFRLAIAPPPDFDFGVGPDLDFIDRPHARRREREIARLLHILDTLPPAREKMERRNA